MPMLFVRRGVVVGRVASASLRPAGAASPRGGRVVLASRRSLSSSEEPFDHVKTEREIGELQRSVREALGAQDLANATEASEALMELARASYGEDRNPVLAAALNDAALGLGRKRVIQRRFNVDVPRASVPETISTLRDCSER